MTTWRVLAGTATVYLTMVLLTGCDDGKQDASRETDSVSLPTGFFLQSQPPQAKSVEEVKKSAKTGDVVTMRGRIGGSKEPFVDGRAVFTLMGLGLPACGEGVSNDGCTTPWDYCCEPSKEIAAHQASIQIADAAGAPLHLSLKGQSGLKELGDLVVVGRVQKAEGDLLVIDATGVYVIDQ